MLGSRCRVPQTDLVKRKKERNMSLLAGLWNIPFLESTCPLAQKSEWLIQMLVDVVSCSFDQFPIRTSQSCNISKFTPSLPGASMFIIIKRGDEKSIQVRYKLYFQRAEHCFHISVDHYNPREMMAPPFTLIDRENSILQQREHIALCLTNGSGPPSIINYVPLSMLLLSLLQALGSFLVNWG